MKIDIEDLAKRQFLNYYHGVCFTSDELATFISAYKDGFTHGYNLFASEYARYNSYTILQNLFTELSLQSEKIPVVVFEIINNYCMRAAENYPKEGDFNNDSNN